MEVSRADPYLVGGLLEWGRGLFDRLLPARLRRRARCQNPHLRDRYLEPHARHCASRGVLGRAPCASAPALAFQVSVERARPVSKPVASQTRSAKDDHVRAAESRGAVPAAGAFFGDLLPQRHDLFDRATQQSLVTRAAALLEPGGYLFIGHSESLLGLEQPLSYVQPAIYRKSLNSGVPLSPYARERKGAANW